MVSLTISLAAQLGAQGIRANCILPGRMWTPMAKSAYPPGESMNEMRARRRRTTLLPDIEGTAWDLAYAALYFASDESRWITGQALNVDGGGAHIWGTSSALNG
jgi:NAD(P)-dependent dehydrogenase (short-subunit alcohol dehydrogenase family)